MTATATSKSAAERPSTRVGDMKLTVFSDGTYFLDGGVLFGVVPKSLWSKRISANERNLIACGLNSLLVETAGKKVLIETGIGNKIGPKLKAIYGSQERLIDSLAEGGVRPEEIDIVINSHLHFDHCGWNTVYRDGKAVPAFANAQYFAQRGEWEHGRKQLERDRISYISDNYDPLIESGQMKLLDGEIELLPGISLHTFPGHTRNLMGILLESRGEKVCYISDAIPTSAHLEVTWVMAFDLFPLDSIESKKRYYSRAIPEKWLTVFTHDHKTPWAYIDRTSEGRLVIAGRPD